MASSRMRFGVFVPPFSPPDEHPALCLDRNLDLAEWLDKLGFDEYWMGEHHSGGWEINASPELFIATAAERTKHIKFGLGVASLPYHDPFILADRVRQLDYLTRGRVMFGVGPGSLPSDAYMMGVPTAKVRDRLDEAVEPIVRLLNGETVTAKSEWFNLQEARLQLPAYSERGMEVSVASMVSPTGARTAGKFGLGLLSLSATSKGSFNALASNWAIAEDSARDHGKTVTRSSWRVVGPLHIAETREKARQNVRWGLEKWIDYVANIAALPLAPPPGVDPIDALVDSGYAVIGTPDDCIAQIERLNNQAGGFGAFLQMDAPWADWAEAKRSYELIARYVIPKINNLNANRKASEDWLRHNNEKFRGELQSAVAAKIAEHVAEKGKEKVSPDTLKAFSDKLQTETPR